MSGSINLSWPDGTWVNVTWDEGGKRSIEGDDTRVKWLKKALRESRDVYFPSVGLSVLDCHATTWEWTVAACHQEQRACDHAFEILSQAPDGYQTAEQKILDNEELRQLLRERDIEKGWDPDEEIEILL